MAWIYQTPGYHKRGGGDATLVSICGDLVVSLIKGADLKSVEHRACAMRDISGARKYQKKEEKPTLGRIRD